MFRGALIATLVALAVARPARAERSDGDEAREPDESISLSQLIEIAVRRSPDLILARNDQRRAQLGETIAGAKAEWRFDASVSGQARNDSKQIAGRVGIAKQLPTGGDLALALSTSQQLVEAPSGAEVAAPAPGLGGLGRIALPALTSVALELRQPVLRGAGGASRVEQKQAAIAADAATLTARDASASTIRQLAEAYWELGFARASLSVRKQSLALAESQLDLSKRMLARGAVPESAVVAAKYGVALRQEAKLRAADAVQSASLRLRRIAGLEIAVELGDLAPTDALDVPEQLLDLDAAIRTAISKNPRIAAARLGIAIADVALDTKQNFALPAIDLGASVAVAGETDALVGSVPGERAYQVVGRVEVRWEIGGAARAAADAARIDRADAKLTAKDVERETVALVIEIARRLRAARQRADVARVAIELAKTNLDTELALFRADKSSNVLVFERQTELDEARLLASRAAADCQIALATLDYLTGSLLDRHGVELSKSSSSTSSSTRRKGASHARP